MGSSISNFYTAKCNAVKESYYSVKGSISGAMQAVKMIKAMFTVASRLADSNYNETRDPESLKEAFNADGVPEIYKNLFSSMDPEVFSRVHQTLLDSFSGARKDSEGNVVKPPINVEAIREMNNAMKEGENPFQAAFEGMNTSQRPESYVTNEPPKTIEDTRKTAPEGCVDEEGDTGIQTETSSKDINEDSKNERQEQPSSQVDKQIYHGEFIPNSIISNSLNMKGTFQQATNEHEQKEQNTERKAERTSSGNEPPNKNNVLGAVSEIMAKKFGPNWRDLVPPYMKNPEAVKDIPDIGFGLDKDSNKKIVHTMSKMMKDIL